MSRWPGPKASANRGHSLSYASGFRPPHPRLHCSFGLSFPTYHGLWKSELRSNTSLVLKPFLLARLPPVQTPCLLRSTRLYLSHGIFMLPYLQKWSIPQETPSSLKARVLCSLLSRILTAGLSEGEKADSRVRRIFCLHLLLPGAVTVGVLMPLVSFRNSQCYSEVQRYAC